jgi:ankyrin repeat protein
MSYKKSFNPINPKPKFTVKYHEPNIKEDNNKLQELFLSVEENNLKKYFYNNPVSLNGYVNNETILHRILNSSNLSKQDKYDNVKFVLNNGGPVNLPNKQNITPLHLACKNQYTKIIDKLIKYKADVNAKDNQGNTPLHYLLFGKQEECKKRKKKRIYIYKNS